MKTAKTVSFVMLMILVFGLCIPGVFADDSVTIPEITLTLPNSDGFISEYYDYATETVVTSDVNGLTISMTNAPAQYYKYSGSGYINYYDESGAYKYGTGTIIRYVFVVPDGFSFCVNRDVFFEIWSESKTGAGGGERLLPKDEVVTMNAVNGVTSFNTLSARKGLTQLVVISFVTNPNKAYAYDEYPISGFNLGNEQPQLHPAVPTSSKIMINGNDVAFDAYNIDGNNYFKLRDLAYALNDTDKKFNVEYYAESDTIRVIMSTPYAIVGGEMSTGDGVTKTGVLSTSAIEFISYGAGGAHYAPVGFNINGNNYYKLRDIAQELYFSVEWDGTKDTIVIDTSKQYTPE